MLDNVSIATLAASITSLVRDVHHDSEQLYAFVTLLWAGRKTGENLHWFTSSFEKRTRDLGFERVIMADAEDLIPYTTWLYRWFCQLTNKEKRKLGKWEVLENKSWTQICALVKKLNTDLLPRYTPSPGPFADMESDRNRSLARQLASMKKKMHKLEASARRK